LTFIFLNKYSIADEFGIIHTDIIFLARPPSRNIEESLLKIENYPVMHSL